MESASHHPSSQCCFFFKTQIQPSHIDTGRQNIICTHRQRPRRVAKRYTQGRGQCEMLKAYYWSCPWHSDMLFLFCIFSPMFFFFFHLPKHVVFKTASPLSKSITLKIQNSYTTVSVVSDIFNVPK